MTRYLFPSLIAVVVLVASCKEDCIECSYEYFVPDTDTNQENGAVTIKETGRTYVVESGKTCGEPATLETLQQNWAKNAATRGSAATCAPVE